MKFNREEFAKHMRQNTTLAEGTISVYSNIINSYYKEFPKLSFKFISDFVSTKNRETNAVTSRPAFIHYFKFLGLDDDKYMKKIPKVRKMPRKKQGNFINNEQMKKIILNIDNEKYRDMALIQYNTGARASEVLTILQENIKQIQMNDKKAIQITLIVKGKRERKTVLSFDLAKKVIKKYLKEEPQFLFLSEKIFNIYKINEAVFWTKLQSQRRNYYRAIHNAAKKTGLTNFGTHDMRRFFINRALDLSNGDIFLVKNMVGHSMVDTTVQYSRDRTDEAKEATLKYQEAKQ